MIPTIKILPTLRNSQLDDYNDSYDYQVKDTSNETYNPLILIHAITEDMLRRHAKIPLWEINKWDEVKKYEEKLNFKF